MNNTILRTKSPLFSSVVIGILVGLCLLGIVTPKVIKADFEDTYCLFSLDKEDAPKAVKKMNVIITAYSSSPDETDDTPFITASGKKVRDGIIANNLFPLGTKIRIPGLYGDKIFVVEDRMNKKKGNNHFDIWFPSKSLAKNFGVKTTYIEVLED